MAKQSARGFVLFEDKKPEEVKSAFSKRPAELKDCRIAYFDSLERFGKKRPGCGIFITGDVDSKYSSKDLVEFLAKTAGSKKTTPDLTLGSEGAFLISIKTGSLEGRYIGMRLLPPYDTGVASKIAVKLGKNKNLRSISLRTAESVNPGKMFNPNPKKPVLCIEASTNMPLADIALVLESEFTTNKTGKYTKFTNDKIGKYTTFRFI